MYKVGKVLKIKTLSEIEKANEEFGRRSPGINGGMKKYMNRKCTIRRIHSDGKVNIAGEKLFCYRIKEDYGEFMWREDWFEEIFELEEELFTV